MMTTYETLKQHFIADIELHQAANPDWRVPFWFDGGDDNDDARSAVEHLIEAVSGQFWDRYKPLSTAEAFGIMLGMEETMPVDRPYGIAVDLHRRVEAFIHENLHADMLDEFYTREGLPARDRAARTEAGVEPEDTGTGLAPFRYNLRERSRLFEESATRTYLVAATAGTGSRR